MPFKKIGFFSIKSISSIHKLWRLLYCPTWEEWYLDLVDVTQGKSVFFSQWVFTIKYKLDSSIERYKARVIAKGLTHTYGIYWKLTFASVAKPNSMIHILSITAHFSWDLHQLETFLVPFLLNRDLNFSTKCYLLSS